MGIFGKMGDMYKLQKQAKKLQKELEKVHVWSETNDTKVTVNAKQQMVSVEFGESAKVDNPVQLGKDIVNAANKALDKAQKVAADRMKDIMGGMQGLMGQ